MRDRQCHYHLDQVPAMEIVFGAGRVRDLRIIRFKNIARAWVENDSVQMENVGADAFICIESENHVLQRDDKRRDEYLLLSGPYMRRFLDGFFPMKVDIVVDYPEALLHFNLVAPPSLAPYVKSTPGQIKIDTLFEGRLMIGISFSAK